MVYLNEYGEILSNHLNVKNTLDVLRIISKSRDEPIKDVYEIFNKETDDGRKMDKYSNLLSESIQSILNVKDEGDIIKQYKCQVYSNDTDESLSNKVRVLELENYATLYLQPTYKIGGGTAVYGKVGYIHGDVKISGSNTATGSTIIALDTLANVVPHWMACTWVVGIKAGVVIVHEVPYNPYVVPSELTETSTE